MLWCVCTYTRLYMIFFMHFFVCVQIKANAWGLKLPESKSPLTSPWFPSTQRWWPTNICRFSLTSAQINVLSGDYKTQLWFACHRCLIYSQMFLKSNCRIWLFLAFITECQTYISPCMLKRGEKKESVSILKHICMFSKVTRNFPCMRLNMFVGVLWLI